MAQSQIPDPSVEAGRPFSPFVIRLNESTAMSPLPPWMQSQAKVNTELGGVEVPLPSLAEHPAAERFVVTVVFEDGGDGGPAVEWRNQNGEITAVSDGLGEAIDDRPLGLNARSIVLPQDLTKNGGTLIVTYFDRLASLDSVSVQPATQSLVAVTGGTADPALVDKQLKVLTSSQTDGRRSPPITGDVRDGSMIEAELSAAIEKFEDEIEYIIPIEGNLEGVIFRTDLLGLDPEAAVEVTLNDKSCGRIAMESFALDGPATTEDSAGRLIVAGWRSGSLYLPARLWKSGENRLLLKLRRAEDETGKSVFVRNTGLQLRFGAVEAPSLSSSPTLAEDGGASEIDFQQGPSVIEAPQRGLPVVITTKP